MTRALFYGDNLDVLRETIKDESIDLVYLDPPFNSNANYNVLFRAPTGEQSAAQIEAFEDTWHWNESAESAFDQVVKSGNQDAANLLIAMRKFLGDNDMMAYLAMMAVRLIELHRVLKPTGSLYLHCDPTASHYLKALLDSVFGVRQFLNEIAWKRTTAHNDPKRYGRIADRIFFYSKSKEKIFHPIMLQLSPEQASRYKHEDADGKYKAENLTAPHFSETRTFEWRGVHPGANRQWRFKLEELERLWSEGLILTQSDGRPRKDGFKEYLQESDGAPVQDIWTDIVLSPTSAERLGYPTQKPVALLERIIAASSNPGDVVLDPFCGCGTAVHAAEKLGRSWVGIDITHLAISLIERRLKDAFPGILYEVHGTPRDLAGARDLAERDKYQFQWWAVSLVEAQPYGGKKKGADGGIDGVIYFREDKKTTRRVLASVKGGAIGVAQIRDLKGVLEREKEPLALFITLDKPTQPMIAEAASAGFYDVLGRRIPRIQIATIADLLNGVKPLLPPTVDSSAAFRAAPKEVKESSQTSFLAD